MSNLFFAARLVAAVHGTSAAIGPPGYTSQVPIGARKKVVLMLSEKQLPKEVWPEEVPPKVRREERRHS